jgi:hypothetical protein
MSEAYVTPKPENKEKKKEKDNYSYSSPKVVFRS